MKENPLLKRAGGFLFGETEATSVAEGIDE